MQVAIIDLGTNTFNLLIAELTTTESYRVIFNTKLPVRLGKGGINNNTLMPDALERGINTLAEYKKIIDEYKIDKVFAFATSAIREAINGTEFIKKAGDIGIDVTIISGDKEADLIYKGVQLAVDIGSHPALIMDIGGGSTEFIIADKYKIYWKQSFLLGVSRILEKFNPSDPVSENESMQIESYFREKLTPLLKAVKEFPVTELIGSSGSFDSFADIILHKFHEPDNLKGKTEYVFDLKEVEQIFKELLVSDREQRRNTKGLIEMRADLIVMAVLLTRFVLKEIKLTKMRLSTYALKEGVMHELMQNKF